MWSKSKCKRKVCASKRKFSFLLRLRLCQVALTLAFKPDFHERRKEQKRKRKRKTLISPWKRVDIRISSTEAETEGTEDFLFLLSPFLLPLSFRCLRRREKRTRRRRKQKEKSLMFVFALPSLLCLRQAGFHGDITDTRAFPLALPFLTSLVKTWLYCSCVFVCACVFVSTKEESYSG